MNCILIGVTPPGPEDAVWNTVNKNLTKVDGFTVDWIANSKTQDDEGVLVDLICAATDAPVDDVVAATSSAVSGDLGDCHTCELWASAPAILPLRPLEGYDKYIVTHDNKQCYRSSLAPTIETSLGEWAALTMKEWGVFVQTSLIEAHEVDELRTCIDGEIANIENLISLRRPDLTIGKDVISFQEIASRGNERFDLLLPPTSKARDFVEHALLDRISPLIERLLNGRIGETIDFDIGVVYSKPGAPNQGWHADGDHQKGAKDSGWGEDGWKVHLAEPYALCLFIPLIDLDGETGYTQFWPSSHRNRGLAGFGPVAEITGAIWDGKCCAGDCIWYDYRLMHRGMCNTSNAVRPVVQVLFKKTWYTEKRNYGTESLRHNESEMDDPINKVYLHKE